MRRRILHGLVATSCAVSAATGCGGGGHDSGAPVAVSGVRGLAREQIEGGPFTLTPRPPHIEPLSGVTVTAQPAGGGQALARQQSDTKGHFEIILPPGTYLVSPLPGNPNGLVPPSSQKIVVRAGDFTAVTLTYLLEVP